ncbi:nucleolar RNA-binding Nop10p family protein [Candidatus Methanoliparum sp. LAM-1]|uniref:nucleolar RNA-binding Nop10p family protein n=1 Tax=Candidatus Methanoliparum sp. LAM-1 TaxID=2874846 RepID=UPI001E3417AF|nr:nucleolar RNA-binding Nop10p family protein [Candidatus Methanoliparum sp. LAM-1]
MRSKFRKCLECNRYTLKEYCSICKRRTFDPTPAKFSLEDRYGIYRRRLKYKEYYGGKNGCN